MTRVRVEPSGVHLDVQEGETIMAAASRIGYHWPTVCGGQASCKACVFELRGADEAMEPPSALERGALEEAFGPEPRRHGYALRLACQARPRGAVTVFKRGVRSVGGG